MGNRKRKIKMIYGIIQDTTAIATAFFTVKRAASDAKVAIIRATKHRNRSVPPSEARVVAVLSLEQVSSNGACFATEALIHRLHKTGDASVAMKCLHIIHSGLQTGSFVVRDQLSSYSANGGRNFLNMARFHDKTDNDAWELSMWVRWYASIIEQEFTVSRILGFPFALKGDTTTNEKRQKRVSYSETAHLIEEIEALINLVEIISDAPSAGSSESNGLAVESLRLVSDDYDASQKEIQLRIKEFQDRVLGLSYDETSKVVDKLKRLQARNERLVSLFFRRKKHDEFWETVEGYEQRFTMETMEKVKKLQVIVAARW